MFPDKPNGSLQLPADLRFFAGFPQCSLDDARTFYVAQFERVAHLDQPDQYYVAILDINAPVVSSDVQAVFAEALVWDCAPNPVVLAKKVAAWLGEGL